MAELSRDEILAKVKAGAKLERADLRGVDLSKTALDGADFRRADLEGANLEGAKLKKANLRNANLREAYLVGADLRDANLDKADLEGANLERANLTGANLGRANLEGATLTSAILVKATLKNAQLDSADLGKADLSGATLSHADLVEAYLGGANLKGAKLEGANLTGAKLEEAVLSGAFLEDAQLVRAFAPGVKLNGADARRATFEEATLNGADMSDIDARHATFARAKIEKTKWTGAKVAHMIGSGAPANEVEVGWVDASPDADGKRRLDPGSAVALLVGGEPPRPPAGKRYFGAGDVLRGATLEFGEGASVEIESRFEQCTIALGSGSELVVGKEGVLASCRILGAGDITIHGTFLEAESPGIVGPRQLFVSSAGAVKSAVEQMKGLTRFAFEPGCRLRMKIVEPRSNGER
jgi:uncharacterized protein YjbI with pentapeptide repeats